MFMMYSTDVVYDRRPWVGYILFPVIVILSFYLIGRESLPPVAEVGIRGLSLICWFAPFSLFLFFAYLIAGFVVFWFFGNAVCSKIGNIAYILLLPIFGGAALAVNLLWRDDVLWIIGCALSAVTGMYLMFWPTHNIDCFFLIPPWRTFSISGFWVVAGWVFLDMAFSAVFGWTADLIAHPLFLFAGLLTAWLLINRRLASVYEDDWTLVQVFSRQEKPDSSWEHSWAARRLKKPAEQESSDVIDTEVLAAKKPPAARQDQSTAVLCECGCIVRIPLESKDAKTRCPECSRVLTIPPAGT